MNSYLVKQKEIIDKLRNFLMHNNFTYETINGKLNFIYNSNYFTVTYVEVLRCYILEVSDNRSRALVYDYEDYSYYSSELSVNEVVREIESDLSKYMKNNVQSGEF